MDRAIGRSRFADRVAPLYQRLAPIFATLLVLFSGFVAVPAHAEPNSDYKLTPAYVGDPMHIPILMYRGRHPEVSWDRNVAAFDFYPSPGLRLIIVGPNVANWWNSPTTAPLDVYRQNLETGQWSIVDFQGRPLVVNGQTVDWSKSSIPTVTWDVSTDPTILNRSPHSEWIVSLYLESLNGLNATTKKGISERIPCTAEPNQCRKNLENGRLFSGLVDMRYITDKKAPRQAKEVNAPSAPDELKAAQALWEKSGKPTGWDAAARMGNRSFITPGSQAPKGAVSVALAPGSDPGGIDFSTLELRYLKEGSGGQLLYAFNAASASGKHNVADGQLAAVQSSDAFFVWLSLPESTFWVNLNPNEPDRIIDSKLGTTDVGRVLLEADFMLKRIVGRLIHPDTELGKRFWGTMRPSSESCLDIRQWIVPKPATVYEQDGGLYIVDAPLEVKMEADYFLQHGQPTACKSPDRVQENTFRTAVLPKIEEAVNKGPEFAELRRIYLSRVAAGWYRERHSRGGTLSNMINSGDISAWPALRDWSARQVFDRYVEAYKKKEFDVRREVTVDGKLYEAFYTYGGVDFSKVDLSRTSRAQFERDHANLPGTVERSLKEQAADQRGKVWFGAVSEPVSLPDFNRPDRATSKLLFYPLIALPIASWIVVGAWLLYQRRKQVTP